MFLDFLNKNKKAKEKKISHIRIIKFLSIFENIFIYKL